VTRQLLGLVLVVAVLAGFGSPLRAQSTLEGLRAVDFELTGADSKSYRLSDLQGKSTAVVVFFRGVSSSYCQAQLGDLQKNLAQYQSRGVVLWAISPDSPATLDKYAKKSGISFPLLSDPDLSTIRHYGILNPSSGGTVPHPTTIIVDAEGFIRWVRMDEDFTMRPSVASVLTRVDRVISID
jgi:peroxiredoxin Q/BCP